MWNQQHFKFNFYINIYIKIRRYRLGMRWRNDNSWKLMIESWTKTETLKELGFLYPASPTLWSREGGAVRGSHCLINVSTPNLTHSGWGKLQVATFKVGWYNEKLGTLSPESRRPWELGKVLFIICIVHSTLLRRGKIAKNHSWPKT